jgi:hypothetical protein
MGKTKKHEVPLSLRILLQSMFGQGSKIGKSTDLSDSEFKKVVGKVLTELEKYLSENVHSDPFHQKKIRCAIKSAQLYFKEEYWWPGVFEGIVRLSLLLMGDTPIHENYLMGNKDDNYYSLKLHRSVGWTQNKSQKIRMLHHAQRLGILDKKIWQLRKEFQESSENRDFILWFREKYPTEYAKVF